MEHIEIPFGEIHPPFNWKVADQAARLALAVVAEEVDCVALQLDTSEMWRLASVSPTVWERIGGSAGSASDAHYAHVQSAPSDTWSITHGLAKVPSVLVIDSNGDEVEGRIVVINTNSLRLEFTAAFSGTAYLN